MLLSVTTPPSALLSWSDIKGHLRADSDDDQELVEGYIAAATTWLDAPNGWLGRAIGAQTLKATMEGFSGQYCPGYAVPLPYGPITGDVSVSYYDRSNVSQTLDPGVYQVVDDGSSIGLQPGKSWPATYHRPDAVSITYGAGFATVPQAIIQAIMLTVGHWYLNRETAGLNTTVELPFAAEALLSTFRRWR